MVKSMVSGKTSQQPTQWIRAFRSKCGYLGGALPPAQGTFESIDADLKDGAATVDEKEAARSVTPKKMGGFGWGVWYLNPKSEVHDASIVWLIWLWHCQVWIDSFYVFESTAGCSRKKRQQSFTSMHVEKSGLGSGEKSEVGFLQNLKT